MKNTYFDLIDQTFQFPQGGFDLDGDALRWYDIPLLELVKAYGTPFKLTYLPQISVQIDKARGYFATAFQELGYTGSYNYCYCTKSNHYKVVLEEVLHSQAQLEISSAYDVPLVRALFATGHLTKDTFIICNGFKPEAYLRSICGLISDGFNVLPIVDGKNELAYYLAHTSGPINIGLRLATEEEPNFEFYTSRLGIRLRDVADFVRQKILPEERIKLRMLHFFVDRGIQDSLHYWGEIKKAARLYAQLRKFVPSLDKFNMGGGLPISNSLGFKYDYPGMIKEIVLMIQQECRQANVPEPDLFTEFGKYTVGKSGAVVFSVLGQKRQNDSELWYMIDGSLMTTLPDSWGMGERFILLPLNKWHRPYQRVNIGGLSCDNSDYYNSEAHESEVYLPVYKSEEYEPLYLGFFHTGAYQDALSGYGGAKHCLIPYPKHILLRKNAAEGWTHELLHDVQSSDQVLSILGYALPSP